MIKKLYKNTQFLVGLFILFSIIITSFILEYSIEYNSENLNLQSVPTPPSLMHPLGTGDYGVDILKQVLIFARIPIFFAIVICIFRLAFSLIFGVLHAFFYTWTKYINWIFEIFQFIPTTLLAILLISPTMSGIYDNPENKWICYTIVVLTLIGIPNLTHLISNEVRLLLKREYVISSKLLGGYSYHIYKVHIRPYLISKLFIWFHQQMLQVMILMMHLALFETISFNVGGSLVLISDTNQKLMNFPWVAVGPVIFFTIVVLSINALLSGLQSTLKGDAAFQESSLLLNKIEQVKHERRKIHLQQLKQWLSIKL
ncbi:peptide ABC transporter permease [Bacillus thuringiensis serovar brasilensis]|uniref:ABC transporter permease n=1 Tax=Bacillus cereus group TaxID=86661 RepID=UPI000A3B46F2|nr:ABC transporter permease subunit [Bacillus thuringiensis]MCU5032246.1 ABC transporter permease subunit [Bacillus cereus]MRA75332.1 ABC transporter permease subunit [Bacillus thuringiensis]MRA93843.1 ABC transporter permease subunit [Bacillus thuringiensis]MRC56563.1 ABC transporter permease subunit [Bacillus thuringiensis]OTX36643.1 peptide ABC transporter permease [Bacillus thuringiensis serovar brasilensis]